MNVHLILPVLLPLAFLAVIFAAMSAWGALTKSPPPDRPPGGDSDLLAH